MLSVLIPVYNYNIVALVSEIHKQLQLSAIPFEIICLDDASTEYVEDNKEISNLSYTTYNVSNGNKGRTATRQELANLAKYEWLLFLDSDVIPKTESFISTYTSYLNSNYHAIYGGYAYRNEQPDDNNIRWAYGKSKEEVASEIRNKKPYKVVISGNFMINKPLFLEINSKITEKGYGYDNYFGAILKELHARALHIDNEVYHLGLESNSKFLNKTEEAINTLLNLFNTKRIDVTDNDLLQVFKTLKKWKLNYVI
ncbi:MAG: glycosyltransferase family 2 protein, partial [Psychroserpens sp.]|nr:glycosyltransferase family 2 protein [Psychroserpens sp.]